MGAPLIIIHGLYGASDNWVTVGRELAQAFEVYMIDQRNHGRSPHHQQLNYDVLQHDLAEFIAEHGIERPVLLGHSMGGKTAMHYAVRNPFKVSSLIIADISPRSYTEGQFTPQMGKHLDLIRSMLSVDFRMVESREDVDNQLAEEIKEPRLRQFLLKNLDRTPNGFKWRINVWAISNNLTKILEGIDKIDFPKPISSFRALFLRGANSDYIKDIDIQMIHQYFAAAEVETIANAGHWLHAEQPEEFIKRVKQFLLM